MKINPTLLASAAVVTALGSLFATPVLARGGGADVLNSPGYQRALQEEHKTLVRNAQPVVVAPAPHHVRKHPHPTR